jgi:hypothetical protein
VGQAELGAADKGGQLQGAGARQGLLKTAASFVALVQRPGYPAVGDEGADVAPRLAQRGEDGDTFGDEITSGGGVALGEADEAKLQSGRAASPGVV